MHRCLLLPALLLLPLPAAAQQPPAGKVDRDRAWLWLAPASRAQFTWPWWADGPAPKKGSKAVGTKGDRLPMCGLPPSQLIPNLCVVKYRITTSSPQCQAFFDQGLGYFYSYVWMEAARSFETAVRHDPSCATAWWALSRALERYSKSTHNEALKQAKDLLPRVSDRERLLITARLEEKGMMPGVGDVDARKRAAIKTLDTLLALYEDDEEGWYARAQLAGDSKLFGGQVSSVPFYKALLRINPLHPGANHELVHFYENFRRPALGWPYAEKYMESSPGIPHAFHMQAHLGTRIGRWNRTTDWSSRAIELQKEYHRVMNVSPKQDWQFSHHLETLMRSLIHDGRWEEARRLKKECEGYKIQHKQLWFHLHLGAREWDEALKIAAGYRRSDKVTASYLTALVYLRRREPDRAAPEVAVLQHAYQTKRSNKPADKLLERQLWETQGLLMCQQGAADGGLKLLAKAVDRTKNDYQHHAWGNGAYYMEAWGVAALWANRLDVAEEAFLEALAHDTGCARAALGLQVLCERLGRTEEAARYAALAQRCWRRAAPSVLQAELVALRGQTTTTSSLAPKTP
ncbi:MAG: tetratricopeptide repeat protein [Gemmataceae bacterium]|nr:tetratricopeptide repeat protein [Gemmataceae bacterium]